MIVNLSLSLAIVSLIGMVLNKIELAAIGLALNAVLFLYTFGYSQAEIRQRLDNIEATSAAIYGEELICE